MLKDASVYFRSPQARHCKADFLTIPETAEIASNLAFNVVTP